MTRIALLSVVALMATGCDRVFGLIGDDTSGDDAGSPRDVASHDGSVDTGPGSPFCSVQGGNAVFCLDFEEAIPLEGFLLSVEEGTADVSTAQAASPTHSLRASVDFSNVTLSSDPHAFATQQIEAAAPTTYDFSVYIPAAMAKDMAIFQIVTDAAITRVLVSGTLMVATGTQVFVLAQTNAIPRDMWVAIEIAFTSGVVDVQIGGTAPQELQVATGEPTSKPTITIGLQNAQSPASADQDDIVVYYDNVLIR